MAYEFTGVVSTKYSVNFFFHIPLIADLKYNACVVDFGPPRSFL